MKTYATILKEIKKNRETIKNKTDLMLKLDYSEERHQAAQNDGIYNNETWKEYHEKAASNKEAIKKLSEEIYILEIKERILKANSRVALINEATPVILEACKKYDGKPYGEKTEKKILHEVREKGYSFYFEGYENYRIVIYTLNNEGYRDHTSHEATAAATDGAGHYTRFLSAENKLLINNATIEPYNDKYTENPTKEAKRIAKAIQAFSKATKDIEAQRRELCDMLPQGIKSPEYIPEYYISF